MPKIKKHKKNNFINFFPKINWSLMCKILCIIVIAIFLFLEGLALKYLYYNNNEHNNNHDTIPIFLATDENYAPYASITMKSILMHTDSSIVFYVMDCGIRNETKVLIKEDLKKYKNKKLIFVDMQSFNLDQFSYNPRWKSPIYSRYFIPKIAPNLKKAIYLDADIIVRKDIKMLYGQDMEDYPIAAMPETSIFSKSIKRLKKYYPDFKGTSYFNSGVLIMDIAKLNQMDFVNKAIKLTHTLGKTIKYPDQDVLNILFENNFKKLDFFFNFMNSRTTDFKHLHPKVKIDPVIIHYTDSKKPWLQKKVSFQEDFDIVMKESVFYESILKKIPQK